ncbi:3-hydroxyacyl-CoA dehydrogenase [Secundilactobacillus mixtipabuli]|uniref:3-hydroxybutyryl-CoA dehydrogenase n=1 Tax=Secundilactobacillus mixtipabuli TaxID=1435342 RepID=A0A1Z5IAF8_9LACO|nr:3-hydroxyacyl-CoA dehydrogenase [Secundilactobacillus mixtipabuli]GAW98709.1 3-hydroxybutyryl-CoA dehydrogenase [Secundilactobacillus mixtipabuli]
MTIKNVTVIGGGVLGSQIAYQTAFKGLKVVLYDINDDAMKTAKKHIEQLRTAYQRDLKITDKDFEKGLQQLSYTTDLATAAKNADLVIEAIPEKLDIKKTFYESLAKVAPAKTIFASNSSTLLPSQLKDFTGRPELYLHIHFANQIWSRNTAEVMGSPETSKDVFDQVVDFAKTIGMVPIPLKKEQPRYVLNSMLIPWLNSALVLWAKGVAEPTTIDKTWMIDLGVQVGPFAVLDAIGMKTHYNIVVSEAEATDNDDLRLVAKKMKERIDANKLGPTTGEGFYHWPNPEFMAPDFLTK